MKAKRRTIALSMACGMVWAICVVWWSQARTVIPTDLGALVSGFAPVGTLLAAMIGRLAQRRFFDDTIIDGDAFRQGSPAELDQRVLTNTVEQTVLAFCLWPFAAHVLGGQVFLPLGCSFVVARLLFWVGYHLSPPLRGLGFAATFYTSVVAAVWAAIAVWVT